MKKISLLIASLAFVVSACQPEATIVAPQATALPDDAMGYYCQMNVLAHEGPKAQIHLANKAEPIWFTQVRDAIAFTRLPEETDVVTAIYVNDMGSAVSWENPGITNWIEATSAYYVLDSEKNGGMGAPEAIPFANAEDAKAFSIKNGGKVVEYGQISDDYILAPVEVDLSKPKMKMSMKHDEQEDTLEHHAQNNTVDHHKQDNTQ